MNDEQLLKSLLNTQHRNKDKTEVSNKTKI